MFESVSDAGVVEAIGESARAENVACARRLAAIAELYQRRQIPVEDGDGRELWRIDPWEAVAAEVVVVVAVAVEEDLEAVAVVAEEDLVLVEVVEEDLEVVVEEGAALEEVAVVVSLLEAVADIKLFILLYHPTTLSINPKSM